MSKIELREVWPQGTLFWPEGFPDARRVRGFAGYVVDISKDYERVFCRGQEYKLIATKKTEPDEITESVALAKIQEIQGTATPAPTPAEKIIEKSGVDPDTLPDVDIEPAAELQV